MEKDIQLVSDIKDTLQEFFKLFNLEITRMHVNLDFMAIKGCLSCLDVDRVPSTMGIEEAYRLRFKYETEILFGTRLVMLSSLRFDIVKN